jgi:hypothetical protein
MMRVIFTVCAVPAEGVIVIVAEYDPADMFVVSTENAVVDDAPAAVVPFVGRADNQLADEEPTFHRNLPPPVFVMVIDCEAGLLPKGAENVKLFVFNCIAGAAAILIVSAMETARGVPMIAFVTLSVAVMVTVPLYVPLGSAPMATLTFVALASVGETVPDAVAFSQVPPAGVVASVVVQFNGCVQAPLAVMLTVCDGIELD